MTVVTDMSVVYGPTIEVAGPSSGSDRLWEYGASKRVGDWSIIEVEWGRDVGSDQFDVELSVNGTVAAVRVPSEMVEGRLTLERFMVYQLTHDSDGGRRPNELRMRSVDVSRSFWVRSITVTFWQDA
jgi:hypothetical protein